MTATERTCLGSARVTKYVFEFEQGLVYMPQMCPISNIVNTFCLTSRPLAMQFSKLARPVRHLC